MLSESFICAESVLRLALLLGYIDSLLWVWLQWLWYDVDNDDDDDDITTRSSDVPDIRQAGYSAGRISGLATSGIRPDVKLPAAVNFVKLPIFHTLLTSKLVWKRFF